MKWLRTLVVFDKGNIIDSGDWSIVHDSYVRSIKSIDFPEGSETLTIRYRIKLPDGRWRRNGVGYLRSRFLKHITEVEKWNSEGIVNVDSATGQPTLRLFPSKVEHKEPITSKFGGFDFVTTAPNGTKIAIEWETGNISSSHRSLNKLSIALAAGIIQVGVLIVPSKELYKHLTDRIGNIGELSAYLDIWEKYKFLVTKGLLAITVVEHDALTDDEDHPYLKVGNDGRAAEGRARS